MIVESTGTGTAFPVDWSSVSVTGTLTHDRMHFPHPISPLGSSLAETAFVYGHRKASREYHMGMEFQTTTINHYRFDGVLPPAPDIDIAEQGRLAEDALRREIGRLLERWHAEHLPSIEARLRQLRAMDPRGLPATGQLAMLDEIHRIASDLWIIHFRIVFPMTTAIQAFDEFYGEVIGGSDQDAQALLVGTNSKSVIAGIALGDLAGSARSLGLEQLFATTPVEEVMSQLGQSESGRAFLGQLDGFLEEYGLRSDLFDIATPTWQEDPSFALATVASYLRSGYDARAAQMEAAGKADAAVTEAREQLAAYPEAVRQQFDMMLQAARQAAFLQEEHNFYIDQQGLALVRLVVLRFGNDLVRKGLLANEDHIFMLTGDEVRELVASVPTPELCSRVRDLVSQRQREMEIARMLEPPPFIGQPPEEPAGASNPSLRGMANFFGAPPQPSDDPSRIPGNPGSRGSVTGVARVARTLDDAKHLRPGEILVTTTTMPPWTPLFGVAAAVVTETGGSLSHCAIVAREYGIPAVVGAWGATRRIETGQQITVDGTKGVITLH